MGAASGIERQSVDDFVNLMTKKISGVETLKSKVSRGADFREYA